VVAVYRIALSGEPFERLMSDPSGAGLPAEVQSAALYTQFELHVMWPQYGALHLIVEGDGDVEELVGLASDYLAGGGWTRDVTRVWAAESTPGWLQAGEQSQWVIHQATPPPMLGVEGEGRRCDLCQWSGVPPHGPPCAAEKLDDGTFTVRAYPPRGSSGGGMQQAPEHDVEPATLAAAPMRAT
jgi:hypothetical protein